MDLSIIILNFNTKDLLRNCLQSVFASQTNFQFQVIVSDNNSTDGSIEMIRAEFPQVALIENKQNLGFSKGNNVAIKQASGRSILLLNSDTTVQTDTFDLCLTYLDEHQQVGALGCQVLLPDGNLDRACRRNFPNPWNSFLRLFGLRKFSNYNIAGDLNATLEVDSVMGAYLMVPKKIIEQVGLLNEDFFMYGEDLDWCFRIKQAGFKVIYYGPAKITHYKYGSFKAVAFRSVQWAHDAMKIFYRKHYAAGHTWLFNQMVYLGIDLRMYLVIVVNLFRSKKSVH